MLGGDLRVSVDFYDIEIEGQIGTTSVGRVLREVFGSGYGNDTLADCSSPFATFLTFAGGACNQGTTNASLITSIDRLTLNQGGFSQNGLDYNLSYVRDLGPGTFNSNLSLTQVTKYDVIGYGIDGVVAEFEPSFDGLGFANMTRGGTIMPEFRGFANAGYELGAHRFNARVNYVAGFEDESAPQQVGVDGGGHSVA